MTDKIYIAIDSKKVEAKDKNLEMLLEAQESSQKQTLRIEAEQTKKDADRESAMAKLKKLGLTDDEIAALVP